MLLRKSNIKNSLKTKANAVLVVLAFLMIGIALPNTHAQCTPGAIPFQNGEQLDYDVYYNLKKIWVPAGKVRFEVKDSLYRGKNCYHFDGKGKSLKNYDYFFKVRDHYASIVEKKTFAPQRFVRDVNEGGFSLYYDYRFDAQVKHAKVYQSKTDTTKHSFFDFPPCTYDVITSVYLARTLSFKGLKENDTIPIPMMIDKTIYDDVYVRYTGKTRFKSENGTYYNCIKFRPLLIEGTIFEDGEYMEVYVTDDRNHIPVYVEAQILVGSIKAYLTSAKNPKYPMEAIIK